MKLLKNKILISGIVLVVLCAGAYFGYNYYKEYQNRFIREANASLSIDDRAGAIEAYKSHIKENPKDYEIRLELANLYHETGRLESAMRVYDSVLEETDYKQSNSEKYFEILNGLSDIVDDRSEKLINEIDQALNRNKKQLAKDLSDNLLEINEEAPFVNPKYVQVSDTALSNSFEIKNDIAVTDFKEAVEKNAVVSFKAGYRGDANTVLSNAEMPFIVMVNDLNTEQLQLSYSLAVSQYGHEEFRNENWNEAVRAFQEAKTRALLFTEGKFNGIAAENQFNEAASYYNMKNYNRAADLLEALQEKAPNYNPESVSGLLNDAQRYAR